MEWKLATEVPQTTKKDLVQVIKDNPGCKATIDNDCWWLEDKDGKELATENDVQPLGDGGYGSGNYYGGDLLQALAKIVGVVVKSV